MNFKRISNKKSILWLVVIAVLMRTLMPAVAHSGVGKFSRELIEVCTATGVQSVQSVASDDVNAPATPNKNSHGEHCPYCFVADGAAIPPSADAENLVSTASSAIEFAEPTSNIKTAALLAARPRGPPVHRV